MAPSDRAAEASTARGGVLVIDKPPGPTSHDIVAAVRRRLRGAKVGHTGTLDPMATGVLPLVVGKATRLAQHLASHDKEYVAQVRFGRATNTHDAEGRVTFEAPADAPLPTADEVARLLAPFVGTWMQTPPAFSAKMADGVRAYAQARRGVAVELTPVAVTIRELELLAYADGLAAIRLVSSAGFYVRAFAHDLGRRLGTGAFLEQLRRTRSGPFDLRASVTLDRVMTEDPSAWIVPLESLLTDWPSVTVTPQGVDWICHGREVGPAQSVAGGALAAGTGQVRLLAPDGRLIALAERSSAGLLHPTVVVV